MVRLSGLIALAVSILSVRATPPNLGWTGEVDIDQTSVFSDDGELFVDVPLTLRRVGSTATELLVEVFATPYRVTNASLAVADGIPTTLVASETVQVQSGADEVSRSVSFRISIEWRDYYISAHITPQGEGRETQNQPGDVVLAVDENGVGSPSTLESTSMRLTWRLSERSTSLLLVRMTLKRRNRPLAELTPRSSLPR